MLGSKIVHSIRYLLVKYKYALLIGAFTIAAFSWIVCDLTYEDHAEYWSMKYKEHWKTKYNLIIEEDNTLFYNPYNVKWHILRWKLFSTERMFASCLVFLLVPQSIWRHIAFGYFQWSLEAWGARVICNEQVFVIFDVFVYIWITVYICSAISKYAKEKRTLST